MRASIVWAVWQVCLAGMAAVAAEAFPVTDMQHAEDTVTTELADGRLLVRVHSSRGFGRCTIMPCEAGPGEGGPREGMPREARWPDRLAVRFEGLEELEAVECLLGGLRVEGSRSRSGGFAVEPDPAGLPPASPPAAAGPWQAGRKLNVVVTRTPAGVLVEFPEGFAAAAAGGPVRLAWVDWLRR